MRSLQSLDQYQIDADSGIWLSAGGGDERCHWLVPAGDAATKHQATAELLQAAGVSVE